MGNRRRNLFILSFVAALVIACLIVIKEKPTILGLDLEGGTELIYQGRPTPQNPDIQGDDIDRAIEIIRKRTDALGVAEPEISRIGQDSIRVGLPNVENAEQAINQVGQTAQLYLYDWEPNAIGNPAKTNVPRGEAYFDRYYDAAQWFVIRDRPNLSGDEIRNPEQNFDPTTGQEPVVTFDFTDSGREAFSSVTKEIAQRGLQNAPPGVAGDVEAASQFSGHFAIVLDQEIKSRPIINFVENPNGIDGRTGAQISGIGDLQEAQDLAEILQIGALPIDLTLISQSTVSATLGEQALDQGLVAGLVGLAIVLMFLIAYYRFLGLVAGLGLLVYALFFLAMIKLIPITLTLPGIAGLILTIGVAADSNIVIFERIKDEARAGRSLG